MNLRKMLSMMFALAVLALPLARATDEVNEQTAREQASNVVRSELHLRIGFGAGEFLGVRRDDELELSLGIVLGGRAGLPFIFRVSPEWTELKDSAVVYHTWSDADPLCIVVVNRRDGSTYRVHGFGRPESMAEFERMIAALGVRVASPSQAESLADFYRSVNPENFGDLTPIIDTLNLKQAAECQCQGGAKSFDTGEKEFGAWWKHAKTTYANTSFQETVTRSESGYEVEWIVLSSPGAGLCGGAALRARLEIGSDGSIGKISFRPV